MPSGGRRPGAGRKPASRTIFTRALIAAISEDPTLAADQIKQEVACIGHSDIGRLFNDNGQLKPLKDMALEDRACIASIKTTKKNLTAGDGQQEDVVEVKLWDKLKALELASKYLALFVERVEHKHTFTLEDLVAGSADASDKM